MGILTDIIILAFIVLCTFVGYKKGLIGVAFKILSFIIAIVLSLLLFKPVSTFVINNTQLDETIENRVHTVIAGELNSSDKNVIDSNSSNTPKVLVNYINSIIESTSNNIKTSIADSVSQTLTVNIINIIVIIALFIIIRLLLLFIKTISDSIADLPILKQFNKLGGFLYGIIKGFLILFILLGILSFINIPFLQSAVNSSLIGSLLYNNNILLMIFF